jgi:hypothetical protein
VLHNSLMKYANLYQFTEYSKDEITN